jgi:D-3-phosphoglycerate dehydrogenase
MFRILVSTSSFNVRDNAALAALRDAGCEIVTNPHGRRLTEDEAVALLQGDVIGMVAGTEPLTRRVLEAAPALKVISRCGIGLDNVDLQAATERGIDVYNTPDAPSAAVAELALGLMLGVLRKIAEADRNIRAGKWRPLMGGLLGQRTVGVIGYGRIGRRVAGLVRAFGARVLAHDARKLPPETGVDFCGLDELLAAADVITLHLPSGPDTLHFIGRARIAKIKPGAVLVNTSRGDLVDEAALCEALAAGRLGGAGLDTFEREPYSGPLCQLPQVVLTAHMGSYAEEARSVMEEEAARNLLDGLTARGSIDRIAVRESKG